MEIRILGQIGKMVKAPAIDDIMQIIKLSIKAHQKRFDDRIHLEHKKDDERRSQIEPCLIFSKRLTPESRRFIFHPAYLHDGKQTAALPGTDGSSWP